MKTIPFRRIIILLFIYLPLNSCLKKIEFGSSNLFSSSVGNIPYTPFQVHLQRVNVYPLNSSILLDTYRSSDSISFLKISSMKLRLPASDSTVKDHSYGGYQYIQWKVTGPTNDSLSGGKTTTLKMFSNADFLIKY